MPPRSSLARLVSVFAFITVSTSVAVPPVEGADYWIDRPIGELGELKVLRFRGNKTFADEALRTYLNVDPHVMSAAHRTAYLKDYVATLESRIAAVYRLAGFNDVGVKVDFSEKEKRIDVAIEEGSRYRYGDVKISGNTTVPTAELIKWVTQPTPDSKTAIGLDTEDAERGIETWIRNDGMPASREKAEWPIGEFASFSTFKTSTIKSLLRRAYVEHAMFDPTIDVNIVAHGGKAELVVAVRNEGATATIDEVTVAGNSRSKTEELIKLIDVKPGARFDRELRTRVERALWSSARFRNYTVNYEPGSEATASYANKSSEAAKTETEKSKSVDKGGKPKDAAAMFGAEPRLVTVAAGKKSKLMVSVVESLFAPPLGTELTPEQAAMLKFRSWLAGCGRRGDDIRFFLRFQDMFTMEVIISPEAGWLCEVTVAAKNVGDAMHRYGFRSTSDKIGLYAFDRGTKYEFEPTKSLWNIQATLIETDKDPKKPLESLFGMRSRPRWPGSAEPTLQLRSYVSPTAAVVLATRRTEVDVDVDDDDDDDVGSTFKVIDGELVVYGGGIFARIDAATGKFISARLDGGSLIADAMHLLHGTGLDVEIKPGLLITELKRWDAEAAEFLNRYDDAKPWRTVGNFLLDEVAWRDFNAELTGDLEQPLRMLRQVRDSGLIEPLAEALELFNDETKVAGSKLGDGNVHIGHIAELLFPRDSWAWVQTREFGLALQKHSRYTRETLEAGIEKEAWGPIALACAAAAARKFEFYYMSGPWAEKGMKKLTVDDFARDCRPLVAESHLSGRFLHAYARFVRGLDDDDARLTIDALRKDYPAAAGFTEALRTEPKKPLEDVLAASLRKAWNKDAQVRLAGLMGMLLKNK